VLRLRRKRSASLKSAGGDTQSPPAPPHAKRRQFDFSSSRASDNTGIRKDAHFSGIAPSAQKRGALQF